MLLKKQIAADEKELKKEELQIKLMQVKGQIEINREKQVAMEKAKNEEKKQPERF